MSLKRNIFVNYVSQIYVTLISIVMVPLYVKYMGAEGYGLVGFFAMLQAWFQLLDMGLTPTMARETARFNGGATDALSLRRLLRALEGIFIGIAVLGGTAMITGSGFIASSWLRVQQLPLDEVQHAITLMAVIVALRWVCGLYRGAISGFERLVWLGGFNIAISTARFVFVIPLFLYVGTGPIEFFSYQLAVALIEWVALVFQTYSVMPKGVDGQRTPWQWTPLRAVLKFSLSIAFASFVWILVTQTDKLVLSNLLTLTDYGYFTLAVLVSGGVMIISGPISGAVLPRMTRLASEGNDTGLIQLYRSATQLVAVMAAPVSLVLALFSNQVLWAWTGDAMLASKVAPVLSLYAIGSGFFVIGAFPYYLQNAMGNLTLHLVGSFLFVVLFIPSLIWATARFGMIGAGWMWLTSNLTYLLLWVPVVHRRFIPGLHFTWLLKDVIFITAPVIFFASVAQYTLPWPLTRVATGSQLCALGLLLMLISSLSSTKIRTLLLDRLNYRNFLQ